MVLEIASRWLAEGVAAVPTYVWNGGKDDQQEGREARFAASWHGIQAVGRLGSPCDLELLAGGRWGVTRLDGQLCVIFGICSLGRLFSARTRY